MKEYNVKPHLNFAMPLVGTEMYKIAEEKGYLLTEEYRDGRIFGMGAIKTENFTPEDLKNFSVNFYKRIRNLYILQMIQDPSKLIRNVKIFIKHPVNTVKIAKIAARYLK